MSECRIVDRELELPKLLEHLVRCSDSIAIGQFDEVDHRLVERSGNGNPRPRDRESICDEVNEAQPHCVPTDRPDVVSDNVDTVCEHAHARRL